MARVTIINSPLFTQKQPGPDEDTLPPLGLGYIATSLKNAGHTPELLDAVALNLTPEEILKHLHTHKPDVVATNVFTTNYHITRSIVESLARPNMHVVVGGPATRALQKDIFTWDSPCKVDVVHGDGEMIINRLISDDLDQLPTITAHQRRFFSVDTTSPYYSADISTIPLDRSFFVNEPTRHPQGFTEVSIVTGRGCIHNCAFCAAARSQNRSTPIREMSPEAIERDLRMILSTHADVTHIRILDDLFLKNSRSLDTSARIFSQFPLKWRAMAHVQTFSKATTKQLHALHASGCNELFVGVESGSPNVLARIHKTSDLITIKTNLESVLAAGIALKAYFIYGFPDETLNDFEATYSLAEHLFARAREFGTHFRTSVFQFRPYHGTELYYALASAPTQHSPESLPRPDVALSSRVGRKQFNFESGNYSREKQEVIHDFIWRTLQLNTKNAA